jgi:CheY-like chemotaxis protein
VQKNLRPLLKTVLVVDDDDDTRLLTKIFLNNFGYEVDAADSTSEALARFNPDLHDLVLTDNSMQGMTGAEMAHIIKLRSPATPVVMYTGNPPNNCPSIDILIRKPTYLLAIKDAIEKLLLTSPERSPKSTQGKIEGSRGDPGDKGIAGSAELTATPGRAPKFRVLVVDDEPSVCKAIKLLLEHEGHEVCTVESGEAALALLGQQMFDVVMTDFCMPGMKGDELVARVKQLHPSKPIIMSTAFAEEYEMLAKQPGHVDALLMKPFSREALRDAIYEVVPAGTADPGSHTPPMANPLRPQNFIAPPGS